MSQVSSEMRFWLRYVETEGGLWEDAGYSKLVVLPESLQRDYRHPDELLVTADADVAREDGATMLVAGHPFLTQAAEAVLGEGDCGVVRLPRPAAPQPDTDQLLAAARDRFPVDHGRIDTTGGAAPGVRHVLRVGALVTFALSAEDHFQEQVECWVDVPSRLELADSVVTRLARSVDDGHLERGGLPDVAELTPALAYADAQIGRRATEREADLAGLVTGSSARETERATTYYDEALQSLQRRLRSATPDRAAALSARMDSTRAERDRRLAEIAEKYRAQHTIRPFRLHVLSVPVLRLPIDVRRGDRRYPLTVDWMMPARAFAGIRCPHCASAEPLVAAKTRLGCTACLPKRDPRPAAVQHPTPGPARAPVKTAAPARPKPAVPPKRAANTAAPRLPAPVNPALAQRSMLKAGNKLVKSLWDLSAAGDRRARRLYAPHSPAEAIHRLFGPAGPLHVIGIGHSEIATSISGADSEPATDGADMLILPGTVHSPANSYGFQMCWRFTGGTALVEEVTPFPRALWPRMPHLMFSRFAPRPGRSTMAEPIIDLDPVARALWERGIPNYGLPLVLRGLAAWWRIEDSERLLESHRPDVLAAAIDRMVAYRSGAQWGGRYDDAAATYQVDQGAIRAAATDLQRRLRMSATQVW